MIIIPDIHGRYFWKDSVIKKSEKEKVIFLGDYLEPYTSKEKITVDDAYENFLDIIQYKKENMDNCILLLGNHDFACIYDTMISCRHDYDNEERNRTVFTDNIDLFCIAFEYVKDGITYLFTHAGVHKQWYDYVKESYNYDGLGIAETLNRAYKEEPDKFTNEFLKVVSRYRAGWGYPDYGSCIWADCREFEQDVCDFENIYQIFGHTQQTEVPIITKYFANLDCRKAFKLDENNGKINLLSNE